MGTSQCQRHWTWFLQNVWFLQSRRSIVSLRQCPIWTCAGWEMAQLRAHLNSECCLQHMWPLYHNLLKGYIIYFSMVGSKIFVTVNSQNFFLPYPSHPSFHWKDNKGDVVRETSYRPIYHCFMDHHWSINHSLGIAGLKHQRNARK